MKTTQPQMKTLTACIIGAAALLLLAPSLKADPLPGQIMKFEQLPLDGTVINGDPYYGHDEASTIFGTRSLDPATPWGFESDPGQLGIYMADDFADNFDTPVVHVSWWGSYPFENQTGVDGVQQFLISFEKDVPASTDPLTGDPIPSHPDFYHSDNLHQVVYKGALAPGSGTFTEAKVTDSTTTPGALEDLYYYNAELAVPFAQNKDEVYWLKIVALVDDKLDNPVPGSAQGIRWGWHNRDYTVEDLLASPVPTPGERIVGSFPGVPPNADTEIWHFQDNAVQGILNRVHFDDSPAGTNPINVEQEFGYQFGWHETYYQEPWDGPIGEPAAGIVGIGDYSKDLAFRLYTVPEPSSALLMLGALLIGAFTCRRRS